MEVPAVTDAPPERPAGALCRQHHLAPNGPVLPDGRRPGPGRLANPVPRARAVAGKCGQPRRQAHRRRGLRKSRRGSFATVGRRRRLETVLGFLVGYHWGHRRWHPRRRFTVGHAIALLVMVAYVVAWWYIAVPTLLAIGGFLYRAGNTRNC